MEISTTPADTVRVFRSAKRWNQQELADKAGVTRATISRIERGAAPSLRTARSVAEALNCDVGLLLAKPSPE